MKRKMLELVDKIKKKGNGKKVNQFQNSSNMWRFFTIFVLLINFFGVCMAEPAIQNANVLKELGLDIENEGKNLIFNVYCISHLDFFHGRAILRTRTK